MDSGRAPIPTPLTGFLAELFKDGPQERDRILKGEQSGPLKQVTLVSL